MGKTRCSKYLLANGKLIHGWKSRIKPSNIQKGIHNNFIAKYPISELVILNNYPQIHVHLPALRKCHEIEDNQENHLQCTQSERENSYGTPSQLFSIIFFLKLLFQVVVSNELTSDASSSFDENLIHLQTLFSALRCPILRTTATKNDRMLAIMFGDIAKMVKKHDYSTGNPFSVLSSHNLLLLLFYSCPSARFSSLLFFPFLFLSFSWLYLALFLFAQ